MKKRVKGFTLLEVLIAVIIFTVGTIAVTEAFSSGLFAHADASNMVIALNIARARLEEIKDTAFGSIADSGPTADTIFDDFEVTIDVDEGGNPMEVEVTVNWDTAGGETGITLSTIVADY